MASALHRIFRPTSALCAALIVFSALPLRAQPLQLNGPPDSGLFGRRVAVLPNGNIVVTDPAFGPTNIGAVYLYTSSGELISTLTGSSDFDGVGSGAVTVLANGNFVVLSQGWGGGSGAATLVDGDTGLSGTVSESNSLVGLQGDFCSVHPLTNGNYAVSCHRWDDGDVANVGAVVFGNGETGVTGLISASNALIGSTAEDGVGFSRALANGNYLVHAPGWDNGSVLNAGAVTWCNGSIGTAGVVSPANSLVGTSSDDLLGNGLLGSSFGDVIGLGSGDYLVKSPLWDNGGQADAGAVTWGDGDGGTVGPVTSANSIVGSTADDARDSVVHILSDGDAIVAQPNWDNGATVDAGAVTFIDRNSGAIGPVSESNSLVGTQPSDFVGSRTTLLTNGNYVVANSNWNGGAGAATWGNGATGTFGAMSATNSLVGTFGSGVGTSVVALTNGNYVVVSRHWDTPIRANAGAVTWANGATGLTGQVSVNNSLVGNESFDFDQVHVVPLTNGNWVMLNPTWDGPDSFDAGAVTWGRGTQPTIGTVSAGNSLAGFRSGDMTGARITALANGNYVVNSPNWDPSGSVADVGAVTWMSGSVAASGLIGPNNSLVGTTPAHGQYVSVHALANGNYIVARPTWQNGTTQFAGAVTWGNGATGIAGQVTGDNSLVGTSQGESVGQDVYAMANGDYLVGAPYWDNGGATDVGAIVRGDGIGGTTGTISVANALIGETPNDRVSVEVLLEAGGNVIVENGSYDFGALVNQGAFTMFRANAVPIGPVSTAMSVPGDRYFNISTPFDYRGNTGILVVGNTETNRVFVTALPNAEVFADGYE